MSATVHSKSDKGTVAFDYPNLPSSEFQFDLDRRVIGLVLEDPNAPIAPLFSTLANLYLRNYRSRSVNFKELVRYYEDALSGRGWNVLGQYQQDDVKNDNLHLYTLQENEMIRGIFVVVRSSGDVYLINIVGEIPKKQLGELLLNLNQLGIEILELESLRPRDLELALPPPPPPPEITQSTPEPSATTGVDGKATPSLPRTPEPEKAWRWNLDGRQIHDVRLVGVNEIDSSTIMKVLKNGSGDITAVMPILAKVLLNSSKKVSLRVEKADAKRVAIFTVRDLPIMRTISVLESLTISGSRGNQIQRSVSDKSVPTDANTSATPTRFFAADAPIHEVHIRGNRKVPEARIRQTLENGSEDLEEALRTLFKAMPYFKEVRLQVDAENSEYIATITVDEKPLSTDVYLGLNPMLHSGFNRVTDWELGTGFEVGRRKDIGPLWLWRIRDGQSDQTSKFFGKVSYASGNPHFQGRFGGTANWGKPYIWNLGLTAQIHRLTEVVAPEHFLYYNSALATPLQSLGVPDLQNYYLRQGAEIALQWAPVMPDHSFRLALLTESHASLQKSTDWSLVNWRSRFEVRENPPITPGRMRSLAFQYDFNTRIRALGWHNTLLVEHSSPAVSSDFDFTRMQLHFRYAFALANNRIRTRLLFGFSNAPLPIQRQFVINGIGGLRGYPWHRQENASDGIISYKSGHKSSPYAFTGDRGFLLNVEYYYRLSNLLRWGIFRSVFAVAFLDEGQVWNVSDMPYTFDPKGNIGIGLQIGESGAIFRVNIAKAFEANQGIQVTTVWYQSF